MYIIDLISIYRYLICIYGYVSTIETDLNA